MLLGLPADWRLGIVPASDTGAFEMAMWSLLGARGVDLLVWESFGKGWMLDAVDELKLPEARVLDADYGDLPDLDKVDFSRDVVFTWNGTTSGVRVPDGNWIPSNRSGLTLCDATSAVLAQDIPWEKIDVATFSWQKVLGGEAAHGMLILGPRAVERLESYRPPWPLPKIFRLTRNGRLNEAIFKGETINTPSMLCVEDMLDALAWAELIGGLSALQKRSDANLAAVTGWVEDNRWIDFMARIPATRSNTSICLKFTEPWFASLGSEEQLAVPRQVAGRLSGEGVAFDIKGYRNAPPSLRLWGGATVETTDIRAVLPWIDWAYRDVRSALVAG